MVCNGGGGGGIEHVSRGNNAVPLLYPIPCCDLLTVEFIKHPLIIINSYSHAIKSFQRQLICTPEFLASLPNSD